MRRIAVLPLLCAALPFGCTTLSGDERDQLAIHQRNAQLYFEGGKLQQALVQVERGLEIDPDDYKLNAIQGAVLLRAAGNDRQLLDRATAVLQKVYEWRSPRRHEPYLLLNLALAEQKQGLRRLGEAIRLEDQTTRAPNDDKRAELAQQAAEERTRATARLERADELLRVLVERGEILRVVHFHRAQIARQLRDDAEFLAATEAFLAESAKAQQFVKSEVERTTTPEYEAEQLRALQQLREEEIEMRALLADWHFDRQQYEAALAQLDRVLEIDPKRSVDYYNRGRVLIELERIEAAKADFRRFLATSPLPASSDKKTFAVQALAK